MSKKTKKQGSKDEWLEMQEEEVFKMIAELAAKIPKRTPLMDSAKDILIGLTQSYAAHAEANKVENLFDLHAANRCYPECKGWFVQADDGYPTVCDDCSNSAFQSHGAGRLNKDDYDAFVKWLEEVHSFVSSVVRTKTDETAARKLFPSFPWD